MSSNSNKFKTIKRENIWIILDLDRPTERIRVITILLEQEQETKINFKNKLYNLLHSII